MTIEDSQIIGTHSVEGAVSSAFDASITVRRSVIRNNQGQTSGAAAVLHANASLTIEYSVLTGNSSRVVGVQDIKLAAGSATATNNWWGSNSGAGGGRVEAGVTVTPHLAAVDVGADLLRALTQSADFSATLANSTPTDVTAASGLSVRFVQTGVHPASADTTPPWDHSYVGTVVGMDTVTASVLFGPWGTLDDRGTEEFAGLSDSATVHWGSTDATLSDLDISEGTLDPAFDPGDLAYTASVPNSVDSITVTPTANHSGATIEVDGVAIISGAESAPIPLSVGDTTIEVAVTPENTGPATTYTITVTRAASTDAELNDLQVSDGALFPAFDASVTAYSVAVPNTTDTLTVTPTANHPNATIEVAGVNVASGDASDPIPLVVGDTTVEVEVTAEDGTTTEIYTLTVTRAAPPAPVDETPPPPPAPDSIEVDGLELPVVNLETSPVSSDETTEVETQAPSGDAAHVTVPSDALPAGTAPNVTLQLGTVATLDTLGAPSKTNALTGFVVRLLDEDGEPLPVALDPPGVLTITLAPDTVGDLPVEELVLVRWTTAGWVEVPAETDTAEDGSLTFAAPLPQPGVYVVLHAPDWGAFTQPPAASGLTLTAWIGGRLDRLGVALGGPGAAAWVLVEGRFVGYIPGAPPFANAAFLAQFPYGLPAGTPVVVVMQ